MHSIKVWVGVVVHHNWKVLLWRRISERWDWSWQFPWGHLEFKEDIFECAKRETKEEVWIEIFDLKAWPYSNHYFKNVEKHYITLRVIWKSNNCNIVNKENHKAKERWWYDPSQLPRPLFLPIQQLQSDWYSISDLILE